MLSCIAAYTLYTPKPYQLCVICYIAESHPMWKFLLLASSHFRWISGYTGTNTKQNNIQQPKTRNAFVRWQFFPTSKKKRHARRSQRFTISLSLFGSSGCRWCIVCFPRYPNVHCVSVRYLFWLSNSQSLWVIRQINSELSLTQMPRGCKKPTDNCSINRQRFVYKHVNRVWDAVRKLIKILYIGTFVR